MNDRETRLAFVFLAVALLCVIVGSYLDKHTPDDALGWLVMLGACAGGTLVLVGIAIGLAKLVTRGRDR